MRLGATAFRLVVGPLFIGHGTQKLFGWFGGHGLEATGSFFESLGLRPGKRHATAAGAAETLAGVLLTLGFLTPVGATLVTATMVSAIRHAHIKNGPWATEGGYEYNLTLIAAMIALTEAGPGTPSVDEALFPELKGTRLAALQLAAGVAGSYLTSGPLNEAEGGEDQGAAENAGDPASNGSSATEPSRTTAS
jgi:putative oxidoreductase